MTKFLTIASASIGGFVVQETGEKPAPMAVLANMKGLHAFIELFFAGEPQVGDPLPAGVNVADALHANAHFVPIEKAGEIRGSSAQMAAADYVIEIGNPKCEPTRRFAFADVDYARVARDMVRAGGGSARFVKARDIDPDDDDLGADNDRFDVPLPEEAPAEPDEEDEPRIEQVYVVTSGPRGDPEAQMTVFYSEDAAERATQLIWHCGGEARYRAARYI